MRVNVHLPNSPRGTEVEVPGLGLFKNGDVAEVADSQVELAVQMGLLPEGVLENDELVLGDPEAELAPEISTPVETEEEPASAESEGTEGGGY